MKIMAVVGCRDCPGFFEMEGPNCAMSEGKRLPVDLTGTPYPLDDCPFKMQAPRRDSLNDILPLLRRLETVVKSNDPWKWVSFTDILHFLEAVLAEDWAHRGSPSDFDVFQARRP
jgi:hypothetical protein